MIVGVAKLDGNLTAGTATSLEIDLRAMRAQAVARMDDLGQGRELESEMVQFPVRVFPITGADQRQTVMIRVAAQKNHTARHQLFGVDIRDLEPQHLGVKGGGSFQVAYLQDDMAQLADMKVHSLRGRHALKLLDIDSHGPSFLSNRPDE